MNRDLISLFKWANLVVISAVIALFVAACSSSPKESPRAPIEDKRTASRQAQATIAPTANPVVRNGNTYHVVQQGETLFSISRRYNTSWQDIASANQLTDPNQIHVGQELLIGSQRPTTVATRPLNPNEGPREVGIDGERPTTVTTPTPTSTGWMWPVKGNIVGRFGDNNRGIDIAAPTGTPVVSADGGKVIFSSNNIRGYGNLIVIRHSNNFLTAYGYNSKLLVKEGDVVKKGDTIAEVGQSGTDSPKLHFEIRNTQSQPEDPLKHLPPQ